MGLVKAAYASLKNSASLTKTEQEECHGVGPVSEG
jgi:hypothetical protein